MKKYLIIAALLLFCTQNYAHIGSPGVTFEGKAGPYSLMVLISPPDVIPGTAMVDIFIQSSIQTIFLKPIYWYAGSEGTPKADVAIPVANEPGHYRGIIWLMDNGTSSIELEVKGQAGIGKIIVPVMAISTSKKEMKTSLGYVLLGLAAFLFILMVTIISSSVSDGVARVGQDVTALRRRRWIGAATSFVILGLILFGGKSWWDLLNENYSRFLYNPHTAESQIVDEHGSRKLVFKIDHHELNNLRFTRRLSYLVPDHGKLMHMFLVRTGTMDAFAHIHPRRIDTLTFEAPLPPLPKGKYLIFADITSRSGFSETIADTVDIPDRITPARLASIDSSAVDRDDTYFTTNRIGSSEAVPSSYDQVVLCGTPGAKTRLPDGSTAIWEQVPGNKLQAGKLYSLAFEILDPEGKPARLEPYLGMMGHAVVMKDDGSVYIHLHPVGNYSMASQQTLQTRFQSKAGPIQWDQFQSPKLFADSIDHFIASLDKMSEDQRNKILQATMVHDEKHSAHAVVEFPYAFPSPGNYRIWIQMKRNGKILNSAFDAAVE